VHHRAFTAIRRSKLSSVVLAALLVTATMAAVASPPASADARMPVSISPQVPSVASGEFLTYNAFVGCSIPEGCTNAVFTFSKPPGASGAGVVAQPYPPGVTSAVSLPNGDVQVTFATVAVGSTKQLVVSWPTVNYYTVPGPQPVTVTGTADTTTSPSSASTTMDVTAAPNLGITKTGPTSVAVDTNFTYAIGITNTATNSRGGLAINDLVISDPLPAGLEFVSATAGATYDPATRTVTWLPADVIGSVPGRQFAAGSSFSVTVRAPSTADPSLEGTTLTNTATATGTPLGGGDLLTKQATAQTGIAVGPGTPVPTIAKTAATTVGDGQNLGYSITVKNVGTAAGTATVSDVLPVAFDLRTINAGFSGTTVDVTYADATTSSFTYTSGTLNVAKAGTTAASVVLHTPSIAPNASAVFQLVGVPAWPSSHPAPPP